MPLVNLIIVLLVIGVILWLVNNFIPTEPPWIKQLINVLIALGVIIWLLQFLGVNVGNFNVGNR